MPLEGRGSHWLFLQTRRRRHPEGAIEVSHLPPSFPG
jgi:hypothetical protein